MRNKIEDLRDHLFATMEGLRDKEAPMDINRAKAVAQVAQTIIESAKVEAEYVKRGLTLKSVFIEVEDPPPFTPKLKNGNGHIDNEPNPHTPRLKAGIDEMREKLEKKTLTPKQ